MSLFEALEKAGTWALIKFAAVLVAFLTIHLIRIPCVLAARVLEVFLVRINVYVLAQTAGRSPAAPVNQFFTTDQAREEARYVHL
jgi:hypothetical protein